MTKKAVLKNIFKSLIADLTPTALIENQCSLKGSILSIKETQYALNDYKNIYVLGSGKAVIPMAEALHKILGGRIVKSLLIGPYPWQNELPNTQYLQSTHPLPSQKSLEAAKALIDFLSVLNGDDLFIYLLSGGTSALVELPVETVSLEQLAMATTAMLESGMPISDINSIRKHLSRIKGGQLASCTQAHGIVLTLSDVIGDDLEAIGSGPLYCDSSTYTDALRLLQTYNIKNKIPLPILEHLKKGKLHNIDETPKKPSENIQHHIIGSNSIVLQKLAALLGDFDIKSKIIPIPIKGDVKLVAKYIANFTATTEQQDICYLFGGEATVIVKGRGRGGRNQHLCLQILDLLDKNKPVTLLCAATDGIDGNSDAAGALIDNKSKKDALALGLNPTDYLEHFDSNGFFKRTNELIKTGPTHNNLLDVIMLYC